mgnify:CR=1 FL=1
MALGQVDRSRDRPAFRQIADEIRHAVHTGEYTPGSALPSETQLMQHFGVARMTVRQALEVLKNEGLVIAEHGRGVFVRRRPRVRRLAADRFARAHRQAGKAAFTVESESESRVASVDNLRVAVEQPSSDVRHRLQLTGRDRVVVRDRRYLSDGHPVETAVSYVPLRIAKGTKIADRDTGPGGIYARLEELGYVLGRFTEEIEARMPTPAEAAALALPPGVPVIHLVRVAYDTAERPLEVCDTLMAGDAFVLTYDFAAL